MGCLPVSGALLPICLSSSPLLPTLPPPLLPSLPSPLAPFLGSLLFSMPPSFAHSVSKHWLFFPCLGFTGEVARQDGAYSCYFGAGFSEVSLVPLQQTHTHTHTHTHTRARARKTGSGPFKLSAQHLPDRPRISQWWQARTINPSVTCKSEFRVSERPAD